MQSKATVDIFCQRLVDTRKNEMPTNQLNFCAFSKDKKDIFGSFELFFEFPQYKTLTNRTLDYTSKYTDNKELQIDLWVHKYRFLFLLV